MLSLSVCVASRLTHLELWTFVKLDSPAGREAKRGYTAVLDVLPSKDLGLAIFQEAKWVTRAPLVQDQI